MTNPTVKAEKNPYLSRQQKLLKALHEKRLDALALNPGPSLTYLTGLHFHLSERPVIAIFASNQSIRLILPELEQAKLLNLPYSVQAFPYGEDPDRWLRFHWQATPEQPYRAWGEGYPSLPHPQRHPAGGRPGAGAGE